MLIFGMNALSMFIFIQLLSIGTDIGGLGYTFLLVNILTIIGCLINVTFGNTSDE